jgi:dTDP-4-dehydrorhamnose reductase
MNGTVAPELARRLEAGGAEIVRWDRATMPNSSEAGAREVLARSRADWVCHVATGPTEWAEWIARWCAEFSTRLLWTGSVSVFSESARAPLTAGMTPCATDDYGRYKIECERRVLEAYPAAVVARLGWQIGETAGSNTMTDYLTRAAESSGGAIEASTRWIPSCTFLDDTAEALAVLMERGEGGVHHVEGNSAGLSLFEIASGLGRMHGRGWRVTPVGEPARDNRMRDERVSVGQVASRLGATRSH